MIFKHAGKKITIVGIKNSVVETTTGTIHKSKVEVYGLMGFYNGMSMRMLEARGYDFQYLEGDRISMNSIYS